MCIRDSNYGKALKEILIVAKDIFEAAGRGCDLIGVSEGFSLVLATNESKLEKTDNTLGTDPEEFWQDSNGRLLIDIFNPSGYFGGDGNRFAVDGIDNQYNDLLNLINANGGNYSHPDVQDYIAQAHENDLVNNVLPSYDALVALLASKDARIKLGTYEQRSHFNIPFYVSCLLYTSPSPRDATLSRMPSSA